MKIDRGNDTGNFNNLLQILAVFIETGCDQEFESISAFIAGTIESAFMWNYYFYSIHFLLTLADILNRKFE